MIEVENLCKIYGSTPALQDVSFSVEPGEILGFLGPNGAGKTTTLRILSGYLPATSGTAKVAGYDVHEQSIAVRQRIGYLPENPPLYPEMTVESFLYFVARIKRVAAGDRKANVETALKKCGLWERRKSLIRKLSKGYRQRVGIAQALVHDPPVIVLDEPTVGLDPRQIIEVRNLIKSLAGDHTIVLSTHILPEVSMTCNRVTIINRGQVVATGSPETLMEELTAGSGYQLELDSAVDPEKLTVFEQIPGVRSLQYLLEPQENRTQLQIFCEPNTEPGPEIVAACVSCGFNLYEMRRTRASLEDVFLQLTTQQTTPEETVEPENIGENDSATPEVQPSPEDSQPLDEKPDTIDNNQQDDEPDSTP
ncbi:ABC transporter ATP-binding protein [Capilliphycus salinus ALCB114379]|uniref:ABC transporter ATP-binding protein n=1 Tax=Capilliphycus salinus TaxID=2768948 RepID=UPI0039A7364C